MAAEFSRMINHIGKQAAYNERRSARDILIEEEQDIFVKDSFQELIKAAQAYDQHAFNRLYSMYADALYRYLYHKCYDQTLAEETLSDLWLRVVERIKTFNIPKDHIEPAFRGWLYAIARNLMIDTFRRNKRHQSVELPESLQSAQDIDAEVQQRLMQNELREALTGLTDAQRDVVVLRFLEGYTSSEVAKITGRTEYAVKSLQHRALGALKRILRNIEQP